MDNLEELDMIIKHQLKYGTIDRLTDKKLNNARLTERLQDYYQDMTINKEIALALLNEEIDFRGWCYDKGDKDSVFRELVIPPFNGGTISQFSLERFGDTHFLDSKIGKLLGVLREIYPKAQDSDLLENHNIYDSRFSGGILTYGIVGIPGVVKLFKNIDLVNTDALANKIVWIFENDNTLARIEQAKCNMIAISASGMPNISVQKFVRSLLRSGVDVKYHGDLDPHGLQIASYFYDSLGVRDFPYMNIQTYKDKVKYTIGHRVVNSKKTIKKLSPVFKDLIYEVSQYPIYEEDFDVKDFLETKKQD